jgi:hypothetical protein
MQTILDTKAAEFAPQFEVHFVVSVDPLRTLVPPTSPPPAPIPHFIPTPIPPQYPAGPGLPRRRAGPCAAVEAARNLQGNGGPSPEHEGTL